MRKGTRKNTKLTFTNIARCYEGDVITLDVQAPTQNLSRLVVRAPCDGNYAIVFRPRYVRRAKQPRKKGI